VEVDGEVGVVGAVGEDGEVGVVAVRVAERLLLTVAAEEVVAGVRRGDVGAEPVEEVAEIGVGQSVAAADEDDGAEQGDGLQEGLGVVGAEKAVVGGLAEDDRGRVSPPAVQVQDGVILVA